MSRIESAAGKRFLAHLERAHQLRDQARSIGLAPQQAVLSEWQSERLAATYADLAAQRRYQAAIEFFLSDLYGTQDFTRRDADLVRIYPIMVRALSENALESLALAVELHALTQELDCELLQMLDKANVDIAAQPEILTQALYAEAYRQCDNYAQRKRQIELIRQTGEIMDEVVTHPLIFITVRLVRAPAHAAGLGELQDFIERGLRAFRKMKGATVFLDTISSREFFILDQIYSGEPLTDWSAAAFTHLR